MKQDILTHINLFPYKITIRVKFSSYMLTLTRNKEFFQQGRLYYFTVIYTENNFLHWLFAA